MKKLPLLFFCVIFLFTSCSAKPAPIARSFTANVSAKCNGVKISARLTADEHKLLTINMSSPKAVSGYTYTYKNGKMKISCDGMNIDADDDYLPPTAFPQAIYNVLSALNTEDNYTESGIYNSSVEYKGSSSSGKFTLRTNFSSGAIESIRIDSLDFSVKFKSVRISN